MKDIIKGIVRKVSILYLGKSAPVSLTYSCKIARTHTQSRKASAFRDGIHSAFSLMPSLKGKSSSRLSSSLHNKSFVSDCNSLRKDWDSIGKDLWGVIEKEDSQHARFR